MAKNKLLKGKHPDIVSTNVQTLKNNGYSHASALRCALCHANKDHTKTKMPTVMQDSIKE